METTVKTTVFAKKLRERMALLKTKRVNLLKKYDRDFAAWKKALAAWIVKTGPEKVARMTKTVTKQRWRSHSFDTDAFFHGAPKAPSFPSDEQIRDIQGMLQHLAITGQSTVRVDTQTVKKFFDDTPDEEE